MSAYVLLNLSKELRKRDEMCGLLSIFCFVLFDLILYVSFSQQIH